MAKIGPIRRRMAQLLRLRLVQKLIMLPVQLTHGTARKAARRPLYEKAAVTHVGSLSIYVADLARARRFYEETLGLQHVKTVGPLPHPLREGREIMLCYLGGTQPSGNLVLVQQKGPEGELVPVGESGLMHMAFELATHSTVQEYARVLKSQRIPIMYGPVKHYQGPGGDGGSGGNTAIYLHDPDWHMVEVYHGMDQIGSAMTKPQD